MFKTGFKTTKSNVRAKPPNRKVNKPPVTFTPDKIWEITKRENELNKIFLKRDLILIYAIRVQI